jgi:predicted amidophosphoribosyltransferase
VAVVDLLLPSRCAGCRAPGPSPCRGCASRLTAAPVLAPPPGVDTLAALLRYDDAARVLVTAVKYRNARASVAGLAPAAASLVPAVPPGAVVTWAPTTPERARHRGFDQAELLARAVADHLGLPVARLLERRPGPHQTGRDAADRVGSAPSFVARPPAPLTVVVVDDVCTTGATLGAAASALRTVGTSAVHALVLARTPAGKGRR